LLHNVGYADVFDPHKAQLLDHVAPLHDEQS
jgi:hypothetical protein